MSACQVVPQHWPGGHCIHHIGLRDRFVAAAGHQQVRVMAGFLEKHGSLMKNHDLVPSEAEVAHTPRLDASSAAHTPGVAQTTPTLAEGTDGRAEQMGDMPAIPAGSRDIRPVRLSLFWHDRLVEAGLILSLGLYYLVGNPHFGAGTVLHLPPYLYSLPFLAAFAILAWYRLAFALALMPLALPYYLTQKTVLSIGTRNLDFSLAEILLAVCTLVAVGQLLVCRQRWQFSLSRAALAQRVGPFLLPVVVFCSAALISIGVALDRQTAVRAFHEEIAAPLLYGLLVLCCLRTRQDILRLLWALLGSALIIALTGLLQYFFFANQLHASLGDQRAHGLYGSANSIGLFFDYALPLAIALLIFQVRKAVLAGGKWWPALALLAAFVPLVGVLVFSQSLGSALALPLALLFILALSLRRRRTLLIGGGALLLLALSGALVLHQPVAHLLATWHESTRGISTLTKRYYLWLSALQMIQHHPWSGVGMDNWLCYYSPNNACPASLTIFPHFWIPYVPGTHQLTGLSDEPTLSHPHNIFLHVWASMGVFGLLAFGAVLALFFWLFARMVQTLRRSPQAERDRLEWMVLGTGGAMLAALCQGLIDSSFLEQDLAFCFWTLVVVLLILRTVTRTTWRRSTVGPHSRGRV
jgi:putative inorganic carbon (HCO3(-)) transporter